MKQYYMYVFIALAVSGCGSPIGGNATAAPQHQLASNGMDYSYIYTEMATSGSCRTNMSAGGGLSAKCN